jgi:hypothetical protein
MHNTFIKFMVDLALSREYDKALQDEKSVCFADAGIVSCGSLEIDIYSRYHANRNLCAVCFKWSAREPHKPE